MAHLAGIVDPDPHRRERFLAAARPLLAAGNGLPTGSLALGDTVLVWAALPSTPLSEAILEDGTATFVLGSQGRSPDAADSDAACLLRQVQQYGPSVLTGQNGYYLACQFSPTGRVALGTDTLGLFPLYYRATGTTLVFSTTPAVFACLPGFTPRLSIAGLVGILLTMHLLGGQTLWEGVRRLGAGAALEWQPGRGAREIAGQALALSEAHFDEPYEAHYARFDYLLEQAVRREANGQPVALMLSGGLDSRLLAGYLNEAVGACTAWTLGDKSDLEMQMARRVARCLGWSQTCIGIEWSDFVERAWRRIEGEHLANGFNDLSNELAVGPLRRQAAPVFVGLLGDVVVGGCHIPFSYDAQKQTHTFDRLFAHVNRYGFSPEAIRGLIRPEVLGDSLDSVLSDLRATHDSYQGHPFQRVWYFDLQHRQRFHVASIAFRLAQGAWPVLPYADRAILEAAAGMPAETFQDRRVQYDQICRRFPALAALPLDRNSFDTSPVRFRSALDAYYHATVGRVSRRLRRLLNERRGVESRYYFRVFDINNPGWTAVRQEAEKHRHEVEGLFRPEALRALLPPPEVPIALSDGIIDSTRLKTLLGFILWAAKYL
ncbi:MAG TPA: asparagine synthase-related protein [Chthonomonadaceae bacterium]|nr:asparagine synthase-related protein [Chthonomonadaceae bacterium]